MKENRYLVLVTTIDALGDEKIYEEALSVLGSYRQEKAKRLKNPEDRKRSVAAGLLLNAAVRMWQNIKDAAFRGNVMHIELKNTIAEYDSAFDYQIDLKSNGKPEFSLYPQINFSLSHSGRYVACAISDRRIGVDVEGGRKFNKATAKRFFSLEEYNWICQADTEAESSRRFFRLWTLKEAYGKMTGEGIVLSMNKAHFTTDKSGKLSLELSERNGDVLCGSSPDSGQKECSSETAETLFYEYSLCGYYIAVAVEM